MSELIRISHAEIIESIVQQNPSLLPRDFHQKYEPGTRTWLLKALLNIPLVNRIVPSVDEKHELIQRLLFEQRHATTYKKWYQLSAQLDELTGSNLWKLNPESTEYDFNIVYRQLNEMRNARLNKDYKLLLFLVRTKWSRNVGNMGDLNLYRHSHVGTKRLIEEYIEECQQSLHYLVNDAGVNLEDRYLLGMLIQTRKNIGRTALVLSGGSTFGVSHIGVLIALLENNLLPRVISGSSAGSIIASILCTHTNDETFELLKSILTREFNFFGPPLDTDAEGRLRALLQRLGHLLKYGTVFDIGGIRDTVYGFVGDLTFREAYNRTGKILNITVSPASTHEQTRLLNYLTGPHCLIWSAVCASCSVPGIFSSNSIYEKDPKTGTIREWNNDQSSKFVDGSVDGDLPITRLSEMFNVDHIIAVQVNPHVLPVLKVSVGSVGGKLDSDFANTLRNTMNNCYDFISSEIIHYLQVCHELNIQKNFTLKMISILTQRYSGNITILPELATIDFLSLFSNPSPAFMMDFILKGARAAWPKITIINNHCGVEFALDKEISVLRGRIISNSTKRVTYGPNFNSAINMATSDSNAFLINAPILGPGDFNQVFTPNADADAPSRTAIRRHNSIGYADLRKKRSAISSPSSSDLARSAGLRGSYNSLLSLSSKVFGNPRDQTDRFFSLAGEEKPSKIHGTNREEKDSGSPTLKFKSIRKARSSGNFGSSEEKEDARSSFKPEKFVRYALDYGEIAAKAFGPDSKPELPRTQRMLREKPNLPRLSKLGSRHGSFIGLDRLKDGAKSGVNSGANSAQGSSQNLKELYNAKNLSLLEQRRQSKTPNIEQDSTSVFFKNFKYGGKTPSKSDRASNEPIGTSTPKTHHDTEQDLNSKGFAESPKLKEVGLTDDESEQGDRRGSSVKTD
ncbi:hypothetical protein PUMCH_000716 [Australozyma saopauloensis]|uniref:PNPLA domain-containing protein n=1 Tax=Australozyma saopauloensis TaxID=291208 RepID=A0AAX4H6T0_9ASCO|nr:hypothetical protein PUMCH_000716 [[Candida] saopauloensis]